MTSGPKFRIFQRIRSSSLLVSSSYYDRVVGMNLIRKHLTLVDKEELLMFLICLRVHLPVCWLLLLLKLVLFQTRSVPASPDTILPRGGLLLILYKVTFYRKDRFRDFFKRLISFLVMIWMMPSAGEFNKLFSLLF